MRFLGFFVPTSSVFFFLLSVHLTGKTHHVTALEAGARQYGCEIGWAGIGCNICQKEVFTTEKGTETTGIEMTEVKNPYEVTLATLPGIMESNPLYTPGDLTEISDFPGVCGFSPESTGEECVKNFKEAKYLSGACDVSTRGLAMWLGGKAVTEFSLVNNVNTATTIAETSAESNNNGNGNEMDGLGSGQLSGFGDEERLEMHFTVYSVEEEEAYYYYRAAFSCIASSCHRSKIEDNDIESSSSSMSLYDYVYDCEAISCQTDCEVGGIRGWCIPLLDQIVTDINGAISLLCSADGKVCNLQQETLNTYFREGLDYRDCDWGKCMVNQGEIVDSMGSITSYGEGDTLSFVYQKVNYTLASLALFIIFVFFIVAVAGYFYWEKKVIGETRNQIYTVDENVFESHYIYKNVSKEIVSGEDSMKYSYTSGIDGINNYNDSNPSKEDITTKGSNALKENNDTLFSSTFVAPFSSFSYSFPSSSSSSIKENNNNSKNKGEEALSITSKPSEEEKSLEHEEKMNAVTFRNISYSIDVKSKPLLGRTFSRNSSSAPTKKTILQNIEGNVMKGEIMAILGPSGSGKSTFLEILALKNKQGTINGDLQIYDSQINFPTRSLHSTSFPSVKSLKSRIAFVDQANFLFPTSTVLEALVFSAFLRLPRSLTKVEKQERIKEVVKELGIENILDSRIGSDSIRGLSGGEKRKLSCGIELLSRPLVLLLDEPTSGLDSYNAQSLVSVLMNLVRSSSSSTFAPTTTTLQREEETEMNKNIAIKTTEDKENEDEKQINNEKQKKGFLKKKDGRIQGLSVIMTIHQPRREIFDCFSSLLVLEKGQVVYHGPPKILEDYLASINLYLPPKSNLADFLLDILFQSPPMTPKRKEEKIYSTIDQPTKNQAQRNPVAVHETSTKEIELISQKKGTNFFSILSNEERANVEDSKNDYENDKDEVADTKITVDETDHIPDRIGHKKKNSSIMELFHNFALPPLIDIGFKDVIPSDKNHDDMYDKGKEGETATINANTNSMNSKMIISWSKSIYSERITKEVSDIFSFFAEGNKEVDGNFETKMKKKNYSMGKNSTFVPLSISNSPSETYLTNPERDLSKKGDGETAYSTAKCRPWENVRYCFVEYFIISQRLIRNGIRRPITIVAHNIASLYIGFLLGLFYYDLPLVGLPAVQNRMGVFMLEMLFFAITSISALPLFWVDKDLYKFEKSNGFYATGPYFTAKVVMDLLPNRLLPSWIVVVLTQYMIGFGSKEPIGESSNPFFTYFVGLSLIAMISSSFNFLIGMITSNIMTGLLTSSFLLLHFLLLTGIFNNFEQMEIQWLKIFPYVSFFNYGYDMLLSNELQGREVEDIPVNVDAVLIELGFHPSRVNMYLFILFCYFQ